MNIFQFLFSKPDESTNDKLGAYPEKVHVRAMPERRYLKTSRTMTLVSAGLVSCMIVLTFVMYMLAPLRRAEPLLTAIDKRFYKLEPLEESIVRVPANELFLELYIQEYIRLRHTYIADADIMNERWGDNSYFFWFSDRNLYGQFAMERDAKFQEILSGLTSEVSIRFVKKIQSPLWVAEFDTVEHRPEEEFPVRKRWRAYLEVGFKGRPYPSHDEQLKNPFNFTVLSYKVGSRALRENKEGAKFLD